MREIKNIPTNYIVTREQARYIAKQNMKKDKKTKFCKHGYSYTINPLTGKPIGQTKINSFFSEHWRDYVEVAY